jgi:hypothetical protein
MPVIYPPKLTQIYGNTFYYPSSIVNTTPPSTNVLSSDGNGATFYQDIRAQFISTTIGLGTAGYISSPQLISTTGGLGTAGYISSSQLYSTVSTLVSTIPIFNFGQGQTDAFGDAVVTFDRPYTTIPGFSVTPIIPVGILGTQSTILVGSNLTESNVHVLSYNSSLTLLIGFKNFSYTAIGV